MSQKYQSFFPVAALPMSLWVPPHSPLLSVSGLRLGLPVGPWCAYAHTHTHTHTHKHSLSQTLVCLDLLQTKNATVTAVTDYFTGLSGALVLRMIRVCVCVCVCVCV